MIVAKGITNIGATTTTDLDGNNVLIFTYDIKYNFNNSTNAFDSHYQYNYFIPVKDITINTGYNIAGFMESVEINYGKNQLLFTKGEYYNIDITQTLDVAIIYSLISSAIYNL
jgi:hypothetical protein